MQFLAQRNSGAFPIMLEVQYNFTAVSGISPTVEVYRETDDFIADWSTNTFVAAGAASGMAVMGEVPSNNGLYRRRFNPATFGQSLLDQTYYLRFKATIPSGFTPDVTEDIELVQHASLKFIDFAAASGTGGSSPQGMTLSFTG